MEVGATAHGLARSMFAAGVHAFDAKATFEKSGHVEVRPGEHCRYCAAYLHCAAETAAVRGLVDTVKSRQRFEKVHQRPTVAFVMRDLDEHAEVWVLGALGAAVRALRAEGYAGTGEGAMADPSSRRSAA